jgi:hypothetical protein
MATRQWLGTSAVIRQSSPFTAGGTVAIGSTLTLATPNGKSVTFTATTTSATDAAAGLAAAFAASTEPEFTELSASSVGGIVTVLGPTNGGPFTITPSAAGSGSPTLTAGGVTAGSGPNWWSSPSNWSGGAVPVAGDEVTFNDSSTVDCLYGLDQHTVTLGSLTVTGGYTGRIGLPARNDAGYAEYRDRDLRVGVTNPVNVGEGGGNGPSLFRLDTGSVNTTLNTFAGLVDWKGSGTNTVNRVGGTLKIATAPGDTAAVGTLRVEDAAGGTFGVGSQSADVTLGAGVTAGALTLAGGSVLSAATFASGLIEGGTLTLIDAAGFTAGPTVQGGTLVWNSTGALGAVPVYGDGTLDASGDLRPKSAATVLLYRGATYRDPNKVVSNAATVQVVGCGLDDVTLDFGTNLTLTRS